MLPKVPLTGHLQCLSWETERDVVRMSKPNFQPRWKLYTEFLCNIHPLLSNIRCITCSTPGKEQAKKRMNLLGKERYLNLIFSYWIPASKMPKAHDCIQDFTSNLTLSSNTLSQTICTAKSRRHKAAAIRPLETLVSRQTPSCPHNALLETEKFGEKLEHHSSENKLWVESPEPLHYSKPDPAHDIALDRRSDLAEA